VPPVGSVELTTAPNSSRARHRFADLQNTSEIPAGTGQLYGGPYLPHSGAVPVAEYWTVQALGPPAGSDVASISLPLKPTHSDVVGHDRPPRPAGPAVRVHARAPSAGRREVKTAPALSTPTQSETDGQESARTLCASRLTRHALAPPAGRVEVIRCLESSAATHSDADGHAIARRLS
jgi:hypothetical protein